MLLDFTLRGLPGRVDVLVTPNRDPLGLGCPPEAAGFPVCTATVSYEGRGYLSALGWIQLVRSSDAESAGFELDPYEPLGRQPHPFCWFGFAPTLFDAPSRATREPIEWAARSFLCCLGEGDEGLEVRALLGFGWGFAIRDNQMWLEPESRLEPPAWREVLDGLSRDHPGWRFVPGFHGG